MKSAFIPHLHIWLKPKSVAKKIFWFHASSVFLLFMQPIYRMPFLNIMVLISINMTYKILNWLLIGIK